MALGARYDGCVFDHNFASQFGGAVFHYAASSSSPVTISNSSFAENSVGNPGSGGAVFGYSDIYFTGSSMHRCVSLGDGGGIWGTDGGIFVTDSTFTECAANFAGGVLIARFPPPPPHIRKTVIYAFRPPPQEQYTAPARKLSALLLLILLQG